jgi:starch synthase
LERACQAFADKSVWQKLVNTGMRQDWSWTRSAEQYTRLYENTLARVTPGVANA